MTKSSESEEQTLAPEWGTGVGGYASAGVRPLINACGIYSDLGGSTLEPAVWSALGEVNDRWASVPELLDRSGERIAELIGTEAARVVPGASAAIALAVATCIAREDDGLIDTLPEAPVAPHAVLQQVAHRYKYTRCALLGGGEIREVGDSSGTAEAEMRSALEGDDVVAVLHPAHLDSVPGGLPLEQVVGLARESGVTVIVDAAYQVYPTELIGSYSKIGADLTCISSKYFGGPNAGGFVAGRADLVGRLATLDFTEFESGRFRTFGRAFKLDRTTVVATLLALEHWLRLDHDERWDSFARRAQALVEGIGDELPGAQACCFTLDETIVTEPVNAVHVPMPEPDAALRALDQGTPRIRAIGQPNGVLFCLECVADDEIDGLVAGIREYAARRPA